MPWASARADPRCPRKTGVVRSICETLARRAHRGIEPEDKKPEATATVVYDAGNARPNATAERTATRSRNVPLFAMTGLLFLITDPKNIPPLRTMFFALGMFTQVVMLGLIVWKVGF